MIHPNLLLQNRYRVLRVLGKGGFAETFEVDDCGSLKVLKALSLNHFYRRDAKEKAVSLFQREAAVLSRLQHPGIPKVEPDGYFTVPEGSEEPLHCLVMEKIDGVNLKQWRLKWGNRTLSEEQAITWLRQLAQILEQLHQQELIHRDIKPSNIMLRSNGQLALIDFGAVREVTDTYLQRQKENVTGTVIISSGYTPPEQAEGHAVAQSDFFALGRTFVFLLTGKSPIDFDRHSRTGKLLWRESAPHISPELADLMDYLMAAFPGQRPQTPQMILRCIEEIVSPPPPLPP
ncbi:serine/threonine protein kinase, partial [Coleofasciculus sp. LEGE 07081]|nr:serine/threonine protein kinase [Coleofasciculus sp. LEGE 07081]